LGGRIEAPEELHPEPNSGASNQHQTRGENARNQPAIFKNLENPNPKPKPKPKPLTFHAAVPPHSGRCPKHAQHQTDLFRDPAYEKNGPSISAGIAGAGGSVNVLPHLWNATFPEIHLSSIRPPTTKNYFTERNSNAARSRRRRPHANWL